MTGDVNGRWAWLGSLRPPFLLLTPACILLAVATCHRLAQGALSRLDALLVLLGAVMAHASVNALNEYEDFRSGLDARTQRTPFSGGSGVLPQGPHLAPLVRGAGVAALMVAGAIGLFLLWRHPQAMGWLLPIGLLGLGMVVSYTPWLTRHPWLCLLAPGLAFGPLMMWGSSAVLLGRVDAAMAVLSLLPFGLVNNLLLLNQLPDVAADRTVGRLTLPMLLGPARCWPVVMVMYALAYGALAWSVWAMHMGMGAALGLVTLPVAVWVVRDAARHADDIPALLPALGRHVVISLLTPLLVAVGLAWW